MYVIAFFFITNSDIRRQFFLLEDKCKKPARCLFFAVYVQERIFQIYFPSFVLFTKSLIEYFYSF